MREQPKLAEKRLRACLQDQYDLTPVSLEYLPRGHDYEAGVYRVVNAQGVPYLLKVTSRSLYTPSCTVPGYLSQQGITAVVAPIPTTRNTLWTRLLDWTVILYPFLDGETSLTGMTHAQWQQVGTSLKRIHQVTLPPEGFKSLRKETFDPTAYARRVRALETQHLHAPHRASASRRALDAAWVAHQSTIHMAVTFLETLAAVLQTRRLPSVICHADLHPANLLRDPAGRVFVIDWDEVMLAPKERDFIFVRDPQAATFWDGYGQREIDWLALTYFRWERTVQDVLYGAELICCRDDLAEETKATLVWRFGEGLAEDGGHLAAAYAAAAHLPRDLTRHLRKNT